MKQNPETTWRYSAPSREDRSLKVGVLGGTFDPVHIGHLIVAEEARIRLKFDEVLFVPARQPVFKPDAAITPAHHRVEMVRRAIASNSHFKLCTLEVDRPGPSYTVDTMRLLREQLGGEAILFFIIGRDNLADLSLWKEPGELLKLCRLVVAPREGLEDLNHPETSIPGLHESVVQLEMPVIGISSSGIRERVAQGLSIRYLVPESLEQYIRDNNIYGTAAG